MTGSSNVERSIDVSITRVSGSSVIGSWPKTRAAILVIGRRAFGGGERGIRERPESQIIDLQMLTIQIDVANPTNPGICVQICYSSLQQHRRPTHATRGGFRVAATFTRLRISSEQRSWLFGSHLARSQAGTTSARGCYQSRRLLLPCASRQNVPTRAV